jgi:hypothetical protein
MSGSQGGNYEDGANTCTRRSVPEDCHFENLAYTELTIQFCDLFRTLNYCDAILWYEHEM